MSFGQAPSFLAYASDSDSDSSDGFNVASFVPGSKWPWSAADFSAYSYTQEVPVAEPAHTTSIAVVPGDAAAVAPVSDTKKPRRSLRKTAMLNATSAGKKVADTAGPRPKARSSLSKTAKRRPSATPGPEVLSELREPSVQGRRRAANMKNSRPLPSGWRIVKQPSPGSPASITPQRPESRVYPRIWTVARRTGCGHP
ncbi:hypothetical protein FA95DRAFT_650228 [Auriscalpium vulgare]|uniref:Uncharacterized protein n=1 Tax=Auriscalpium vulgare TaxID=40419 RepID=A0ACB8RCQ3_9AGAM|nr:hypothetical protein FA95DRAFT_650228 [Auriscalpium vulgare]